MNEFELAERFNRELDGVFLEGKSVPFAPDQAAMDFAAELASADHSGDSAIRESLREWLVPSSGTAALDGGAVPSGWFAKVLLRLPRNVYARAALAAACLLLALVPIFRRSDGQGGERGHAPSAFRTPRSTERAVVAAAAAPRKPSAVFPAGARSESSAGQRVFHSRPMARLESEPIRAFPIESAGTGTPIVLAKGREVRLENGSRVVLETEHAVITLERRVISPEELFERRSL